MFVRAESLSRVAVSLAATLVAASALFAAALPVFPVA
jgi:hypothetical protein